MQMIFVEHQSQLSLETKTRCSSGRFCCLLVVLIVLIVFVLLRRAFYR
jgi:ABC-type uncharacterized transport system YnjBCD permease subunit